MGKNTQRVQDMLDGNYKNKIQVGYSKPEQKREIGERWTDSDGKEWEQKNGYIASIKKTPNIGLGDCCSDCKSLIVKSWDIEIFKFMSSCKSFLQIEVLPAPDGEEIIMIIVLEIKSFSWLEIF